MLRIAQTDIAIMTPTPDEWLGMVDQMSEATDIDDLTLPAKLGHIGKHFVLCCLCGKGQEKTAAAASIILERAKPSWVFLVGIAGGFPNQGVRRGDVVIANVVHSFDYGKLVRGAFNRRPENDVSCDPVLLSWAGIAAAQKPYDWRKAITEPRPDSKHSADFKIHTDAYIASSDKVVDDPDHQFYSSVAAKFPEIHAVEMEGIGAGASTRLAQTERAVGFLMIRGISDEPGASDGRDQRAQWKRYSVATAAAFTRRVIEELPKKKL